MNSRLLYIAIGLAGIVAIIYLIRSTSGLLPDMGSDQIAYLIYMSIWGSLVAAAVVSQPQGWGHSLKQLVIWVGIFLVLMAGYTYRYELQDMASNLTFGLVPGSVLSSTSSEGRQQITLLRDPSGHFQARGKVDSAEVLFLVDTGATDVVLSYRDAERVGIDTNALSFSIPVSTANGTAFSARHRVSDLSIGPIKRGPITIMVSAKGALDQSLLGMNFINRLYGFEIRGDRMTLTD